MDIRTVREIIQYGPMTTVPLMPGFVRGVINLRGAVVPVIDLQARFGKPSAVVSKKTCIVIFDAVREGERVELGLLVDAVSEVIEIAASQIEPPPQFWNLGAPRLHPGHGQGGRPVCDPDRARQSFRCGGHGPAVRERAGNGGWLNTVPAWGTTDGWSCC